MTIRNRITILVIMTFIAISLIGGFSVYRSRSSANEVKLVTQGVVPSALASAELVGQLKDVQLAVMTIISSTDMKLAAQAEERLQATQATLQKAFDQQLMQADSEAQRGLVKIVKENLVNYFASIKETVGFKLAGKNELADANLTANVGGYLQEMEGAIETLQIEKRRSKDVAIATLNENLSGTTLTIAGVTLIAVLLLASFGVLLYRQITRPISEMEAKMTEIASSQDFTQRVPVKRQDEIGRSLIAFNTMIEKIEQGSELIKQKTADIQAMLHYIPQGILTIEAGNRIHPEYSVYLESILETGKITGENLMTVVFANTQCNPDLLSQIETTVSACIGEDQMNFEFNVHLLPLEIKKSMPDGRLKTIDLNWSPITDENGTIQRILLCLRDVTELRALASEASEQKRELAIIGEILSVRQEKFHEFIQSALHFVAENRRLIETAASDLQGSQRGATIDPLFRNMHTIKGNARTYGLLHLTHIVHETEQTYDELRHNTGKVWDRAQLMAQLDSVENALNEYAKINEIKLGRRGPGRRGGVDKFLMVAKEHIAETLEILNRADTNSVLSLRNALRNVRQNMELIGTEKIGDVLAGILDSLPALAKELGKEPPRTSIDDHGIVIRNQIADTLKNVFMHLYRNSVDHGLETAAKRVAHGKAPAGHIQLSLTVHDDELLLKLQDDGRGLAVHHIRQTALNKGLIASDDVLNADQIAQLIFMPGFSTSERVTEVSGRGVGMDAVRGFIKTAGGSIALSFTGGAPQEEYRPFETIMRLPAKYAVVPALSLLQQMDDVQGRTA